MTLTAAMGIKKKIKQQFYFEFCHRKGQIQQHYDGKKFREKVIIFGISNATMH